MDFFTNDSEFGSGDEDFESDCHDPMFSRSVDLALCVVYILLAVVGTAGNIMVCISVFITPNLQTTWNYLLVSLSIADTIGTGLYFPLATTDLIQHYRGVCLEDAHDIALDVAINVSFAASLLTITLVGIERALVVIWPLKHTGIMTTTVFRLSLVAIWFVAGIFGVGGATFEAYFTSFLSIPMYVIMLVCYTAIYVTIKRRNNDITRHTRRNTVEKRVVKTILIVTVVFTLLWAPMFAFLFSGLMGEWEDIAFPLAASSAVFNPFIYCYRNSEYKKAFKRIIFPQCFEAVLRSRRISSESSTFHEQKTPSSGRSISVISFTPNSSETGENNR